MRKRIAAIILIIAVITIAMSASSCSGKAPEVEDVRDRIVYLIENSKDINTLFFGMGLPTYERGGLLSDELGVYYDDKYPSFDRVMENSRYISIEEMKIYAERVYSREYLDDIYETAFEGYMTGSSSAYMRFLESTEWIYQNTYATDFKLPDRIYDYSTIKIVKPSSAEYMNITIDTYTLDDRTPRTVSLSFTYERGDWYLDSPTY